MLNFLPSSSAQALTFPMSRASVVFPNIDIFPPKAPVATGFTFGRFSSTLVTYFSHALSWLLGYPASRQTMKTAPACP